MDIDKSLDRVKQVKGLRWLNRLRNRIDEIPGWVSKFHPEKLPCAIEGDELYGSFNLCQKVVFSNNEAWIIRFPIPGKTSDAHLDEKVASEVAALKLLHERTDIPVPKVKAWGVASDNALGLGPFIMEEFIQGVSLKDILRGDEAEGSMLLRNDLDDRDIEIIYRQLARFMLQIFDLNFSQVGDLPLESTTTPPRRPLTLTAHEITRLGGVDVLGPRSPGFPTTKEYFNHVVNQHWRQLLNQLNSVENEDDARQKYIFFKILRCLTDRHVWPEYDHGPFKLICDDLGLANMIVDSRENLTITGVVDLEWAYAGPAQLLGTAPWWLLQERPELWDATPETTARFLRHLSIFKRVLAEEEEENLAGGGQKELSKLIERSETEGTMWYHMILQGFFHGPGSLPWEQLKAHTPHWDRLVAGIPEEEISSFVAAKMAHLRLHDERL
ncbi:phosphotransferase enzyme family protein, partial [Podospora appendiculata]